MCIGCIFLYISVHKASHLWTQFVYRLIIVRNKQSSFTYLCVVYWMVLSVIQIMCSLMGLLVNWKRYRRKLWFSWRYCSSTCLEGLKKTVTNDSWEDNQYLNLDCPKYRLGGGGALISDIWSISVYNMVTSVNFSMCLYFITFWHYTSILLGEFNMEVQLETNFML
jgi:hypothetical protein